MKFHISYNYLKNFSFKLCTDFIYIKEDVMNKKNTDFYA